MQKSQSIAQSKKNLKNRVSNFVADKPGVEGEVTSGVENTISQAPSMLWLGLAGGSMIASAVILSSAKKKEFANFVGLWAPCFLLIGIYNKLVKLDGNDALHGVENPRGFGRHAGMKNKESKSKSTASQFH